MCWFLCCDELWCLNSKYIALLEWSEHQSISDKLHRLFQKWNSSPFSLSSNNWHNNKAFNMFNYIQEDGLPLSTNLKKYTCCFKNWITEVLPFYKSSGEIEWFCLQMCHMWKVGRSLQVNLTKKLSWNSCINICVPYFKTLVSFFITPKHSFKSKFTSAHSAEILVYLPAYIFCK